jgi:hypothetical protein
MGIGWRVRLATHMHQALRLRMSGAVPLLPLYALMVWTGTTLLFNVPEHYNYRCDMTSVCLLCSLLPFSPTY